MLKDLDSGSMHHYGYFFGDYSQGPHKPGILY